MSPELASVIQTISGIVTLAVAITSIVIALNVEMRNRRQFRAQLNHSRELTAASIRPFLSVYSRVADEMKSISLVNRGIGPAVITAFEMNRGDKFVDNLKDLFDIGEIDLWEKWRRLLKDKIFLSPGQEIILVKMTKEHLISRGCSDEDADALLVGVQKQKKGITVRFEYEDALGTRQDPCISTLV